IAVGGSDVDADQHRLVRLEDLVVGADADAGQVVPLVEGPGSAHGGAGDAVQVAQRARAVEQVAEQFVDAAVGAVAHQEQGQDEGYTFDLRSPGPGSCATCPDLLPGFAPGPGPTLCIAPTRFGCSSYNKGALP